MLDPAPFRPDAVSAETTAWNTRLAEILKAIPPARSVPVVQTRELRESGKSVWGPIQTVEEARWRELETHAGPLRVRVIAPAAPRGVYLHVHGGGWVFGAAHHSDVRNLALAKACGLAVVSVDYRLAPEHPYPAGADDCENAALWLVANAKREFGSDALAIGGESAGAHLAALTLLRLRDRHQLRPFRAANLVYGCFDLGLTPSARAGRDSLVLDRDSMAWFVELFTPRGGRREPEVSPLFAPLDGLPPALFTIGTADPLLDDSLFMHARWLAAGSRAELAVYPGGVHGFNAFPISIARAANARIDAFLSAALS